MDREEIEKLNYIKEVLTLLKTSIEERDSMQVNQLFNELSILQPKEYKIHKSWFTYLISNFEDYMETESTFESVFLNAINRCQFIQDNFKEKVLSNLLFFEYKLIDVLTEEDPSYFENYNADYQIDLLNKSALLNPNNAEIFLKRAYIHEALGNTKAMELDFTMHENLTENSDDEFSNLDLAMNYEIRKKNNNAISTYQKMLAHCKSESIKKICYQRLASIYAELGDYDKEDYYLDQLESLE